MLRVDLGALAGAVAPWVLVYPLMADSDSRTDEKTAGALSLVGMTGGAVIAWFLTRNMDASDDESADVEPPVPALVQRDGRGRWQIGAPVLGPAGDPALSPHTGGLGVSLLGGRF
jgi:hypothetical protein